VRRPAVMALSDAKARLMSVWTHLADVWRDEVRKHFESEFWLALEEAVRRYADTLEELEAALEEAERQAQ
jgi:uncharacterized protein YukE